MDLARAMAARGARDDARKHLIEAAEAFSTAGTPVRVAQVRELAGSLGIDL